MGESLKPEDSQGVLMNQECKTKEITQRGLISQATSFIQFKSKEHFDACAEAATKNDLSQTALTLCRK